jgi:flagellar hook assembly protein FlgD
LKLGKVLLVDCVGGAIRGAKRYVGGDATEQAEVFMEEGAKPLQKVTSWDPNEKIAPDGYGTQRFLSTIGRMNYQILFENKKEATAPAYTIVVVDTLQADFDSTSVVFEKTSHDGPAYNWQMSRNGNILKWRIDAIELPPNVNPPEGEGYVTFSVKPKSGTASGTVLKNTATITFDINAPIRTNQVLNTLDFTPPTTVMKPIPAKLTSGTIVVKWQATDGTGGSGVASTTVFASKDGGPYISVGTSSSDSLVFTPSGGSHKYTFYALAKDNVGNVESVRPAIVTTDIVNDVEEKIPVPTEFSLSQNYPNPFNPTTQIVFSLSATVRATLKVYDMLGREIVTLVDEERNPGRYTVQWDASKVASGVYFYRLIVGDFVQTRKLVLIK